MMRLNGLTVISLILAIIGALNWGLVGLFGIDLVATLLGTMTLPSRVVYVLVGLAGVGLLIGWVAGRSNRSVTDRYATSPRDAP